MMLLAPQVPQPPPAPPMPPVIVSDFPTPPPWMTLPPAVTLLIALAFIAGVAFVLYPLARALARRLEGRAGSAEMEAQLEDLRERVRELEGVQGRVAELEERLDFTERMLTQRRDHELPRG